MLVKNKMMVRGSGTSCEAARKNALEIAASANKEELDNLSASHGEPWDAQAFEIEYE